MGHILIQIFHRCVDTKLRLMTSGILPTITNQYHVGNITIHSEYHVGIWLSEESQFHPVLNPYWPRVQVAHLINAFSRHDTAVHRSCYVHGSCYVARKKVDTNQQRLEAQNITRVHNFIFWNLILGSDFGVVVLSSLHVCGPVIGPPGSLWIIYHFDGYNSV